MNEIDKAITQYKKLGTCIKNTDLYAVYNRNVTYKSGVSEITSSSVVQLMNTNANKVTTIMKE